MKIPHSFRVHSDWILLSILICVVCTAIGISLTVLSSDKRSAASDRIPPMNTYNPDYKTTYGITPPDPRYPIEGSEQLGFSQTKNIGDFSIELVWVNRNINREEAVGAHSFELRIYNSRNRVMEIPKDMTSKLTVGCIARDNPYRRVPVEALKPLVLQPYEERKVGFGISIDCLYIGTADGAYFWRIY